MEALLQKKPSELAKGLDKASGSYLTFKQDKNSAPPFSALGIPTFPTVPRGETYPGMMRCSGIMMKVLDKVKLIILALFSSTRSTDLSVPSV